MPLVRHSGQSGRALTSLVLAGALIALAGCSHKSVDDYLHDGDQARQAAQLAQAEVDYQSAIKAAPGDSRPYLALGQLYMFEKKADAAQVEFAKALELTPKNAAVHAALGDGYAEQTQLGAAENQYRGAVALDSGEADYRLKLGAVLQKGQKLGAAETEFRTAIGLEPKNAHAHLALADLLNAEGNRATEAQAEYAQVRALDPSLAPASPAAAVPPSAMAPTTATAPVTVPKLLVFNHLFLLTKNSPVFDTASSSGRQVAQVHRGKKVHVTAITADKSWLEVRLKTGVVGFIPATATE